MDKCETCVWYVYDEDYDDYICDMDLDEDELARFLAADTRSCPYWRPGDDYYYLTLGLMFLVPGGHFRKRSAFVFLVDF